LIGHAQDLSEGEPLHSGHPLVRAAVEEVRKTSSGPLAEVELGEGVLPQCLAPHVGRRGRLVVTKVAYRGLEPVDHLLVTAVLEGENTPLARLTVESLLALSVRDVSEPGAPPGVDRAVMGDAIEEAVLEDQAAVTSKEQDRFNRKLEQLDRYLEDQVLVLKRKQAVLERSLEIAENKKQKAGAP